MRPRTTGILFLVAVLLGAFIYLHEFRGGEERGAMQAESKRLFPDVEASQIDRITLTASDGQRAHLERSEGRWRLTSPLRFAGDEVTLDGMASTLAQLEIEGRVQPAGAAEDFGLADEADALIFEVAGKRRGLRIGRRTPVGSNTYVKTLSDEAIVYLQTWRINALSKSLSELRDRRVLDFDTASVQHVSVRWPDGRAELERRESHWWLVEPLTEPADSSTLETLLSDLAFLRADGFVDEQAADEELGLTSPRFQVLLSGADDAGEPFKLGFAVGAQRAGKLVARGKGGTLYALSQERLDDFPRDLVAYRQKRLAHFEAADARSFELVFNDSAGASHRVQGELLESGWVTAPETMADGKAGALVAELGRLEAIDIVAEELGSTELAAVGLSPPRVVIRVWGEGAALRAHVAIGLLEPGRGLLAQRIGSPVVYRLHESLAAQIPASHEAFEADFLPANADVEADANAEPDPELGDLLAEPGTG